MQGYETTCYEQLTIPPPEDILEVVKEKESEDEENKQGGGEGETDLEKDGKGMATAVPAVQLTDQQVRAALLSLVSSHFCWGSGVAKQMVVTSMEYVPAHHYELQTFAEKRETNWVYAPHKGLDLDSATSGRAPLPWDIPEPPSNMFKEEVKVVTVPHTGVVKTCHKCRGNGGMTCGECYGKGWVRCLHCHGGENLEGGGLGGRDRCYYCHQSKYGHGNMDCEKCQVKLQLSLCRSQF